MRRANLLAVSLVAASACARPEAAREWPAEHPLRAEARDEAPAELPSLAPRFELPAAPESGAHDGHAGHGNEREVRP